MWKTEYDAKSRGGPFNKKFWSKKLIAEPYTGSISIKKNKKKHKLLINGVTQVIIKIKWNYTISMGGNTEFIKLKEITLYQWCKTKIHAKYLKKKSTMCMKNIKIKIKYTKTLCRVILLWSFYFLFFCYNVRSLPSEVKFCFVYY